MAVRNAQGDSSSAIIAADNGSRKGMVLPFQPLLLAFSHVNYYVDMPAVSHVSQRLYIYCIHVTISISALFK